MHSSGTCSRASASIGKGVRHRRWCAVASYLALLVALSLGALACTGGITGGAADGDDCAAACDDAYLTCDGTDVACGDDYEICLATCDGNDGKGDGVAPDVGGGDGTDDGTDPPAVEAGVINIAAAGSLQNPCFSPDGSEILFTIWRGGYNMTPAVVARVPVTGGAPVVLTDEGGAVSVNLPGSCWSSTTGRVTFSTTAYDDRDEIYTSNADGSDLLRATNRPGFVAYEPSLSPDGEWIVFESHVEDTEGDGALFKVRTDGTDLTQLTDGTGDDRQPNWSPAGDRILFQSHKRGSNAVDLFTMDPDGGSITNITRSASYDTDASFSPDGQWIVYSSDRDDSYLSSIFVIPVDGGTPVRITNSNSYDGAPSWSSDGRFIAYESSDGEPDGSAGTRLMVAEVPTLN
jgi:TolB protein